MTTPTKAQREQWRRLADAATPGPLKTNFDMVLTRDDSIVADCWMDDDAAFIAAAREAVPALLSALDAAEARERGTRKALEEIAKECHRRAKEELDFGMEEVRRYEVANILTDLRDRASAVLARDESGEVGR